MWDDVFWTHDLRRLHGVSISRNPYPCRPMAWISFVFECNWSSLVWLWAKQKQTAKAVNTNTTLNHAVLTFDNWCKESCFFFNGVVIARGVLSKCLYGEAPPHSPTPYPFIYHFSRKRYPLRIPSIDKWCPFHIPCLELCIPFKCTVF